MTPDEINAMLQKTPAIVMGLSAQAINNVAFIQQLVNANFQIATTYLDTAIINPQAARDYHKKMEEVVNNIAKMFQVPKIGVRYEEDMWQEPGKMYKIREYHIPATGQDMYLRLDLTMTPTTGVMTMHPDANGNAQLTPINVFHAVFIPPDMLPPKEALQVMADGG